jgi:hypothetical protein
MSSSQYRPDLCRRRVLCRLLRSFNFPKYSPSGLPAQCRMPSRLAGIFVRRARARLLPVERLRCEGYLMRDAALECPALNQFHSLLLNQEGA